MKAPTIIGAGSWGTALAIAAREAGCPTVSVWARRPDLAAEISKGSNERYMPGIELPDGLLGSADLEETLRGGGPILMVVPSRATVPLCQDLLATGATPRPVVLAAKGLDKASGRRLSEMAVEVLGPKWPVHVLLGPSHAEEVARRMPTAIVLSGGTRAQRAALQAQLSGPSLRIYTNPDLAGVEYAAALKNVLAIAAGICDGLGLGDNTKGALLTRGLAEIARLGVQLGGERETFYGLAGIGDVITTCLSRHSRNRAMGEHVGRGLDVEKAAEKIGQVVEGVGTTETVVRLARAQGIIMPITESVGAVLFEGADPAAAIEGLMSRSLKPEWEARATGFEGGS